MKKPFLTLFVLTLGLSSHVSAFADAKSQIAEAYDYFRSGAYVQAIEAVEKVTSTDRETLANVAFFKATAYSKMQDFEKAATHYQEAARLKSDADSLHYDYGQALFALQKLKEAEASFKKSIVKNFKVAASAYYVAFIRQMLEDEKGALDFYNRIQRLSHDKDQVKQAALYQIAEIQYGKAPTAKDRVGRKKFLKEVALPAYKKALNFASGTTIHDEAKGKVASIEGELNADVERMNNGVPLPKQPYSLRISQTFGYDSNVTTTADETLVAVSNKDSYFSTTNLMTKYQFNAAGIWSFIPELSTSGTFYLRRGTPQVYQNDNVTIAPALRTKFEHTSGGQPATMLLELEFNLMLRDYTVAHKLPYYSRYWNLTLGERVKWFDTGTSTLKLSIKAFESYNPARNSYSPTVSFQQNFRIFGKWDWSNTLSADALHARDDFNDEKNYKIRSSVALTKLLGTVDVTPALTVSLKDTMKQRGSRGTETYLNPALTLSKEFSDFFDGAFDYSYTKNYSESKTSYQYTKHELKFTGTAKF